MEWQHPEWLYLILPLGADWLALAVYSRHRRRRAAEAFVAQAMWSRILPANRDQAILLITDGDDQQSYPLEAAAVAAERHVTIFTVGLGDADHGARIPQGAAAKSYLEYQGHQVWSKLDGSLL